MISSKSFVGLSYLSYLIVNHCPHIPLYSYTDVPPGSICCVDPVYDRVSVGLGDTCCSGVPFMQNGPQLCCNGVYYL